MTRLMFIAAAFAVIACDQGATSDATNDGGTDSDIATAQDVLFTCSWLCDAASRCGDDDRTSQCSSLCVQATPDQYNHDFVRAFGECLKDVACEVEGVPFDDHCWDQALAAAGMFDVSTCMQTVQTCNIADITCADFGAFFAPQRQMAHACSDLACSDAKTCLDQQVFQLSIGLRVQ